MTDITHIRTHEGFAYLAVLIDLFSRRIVGMVHAGPADDQRRASGAAGRRRATQAEAPCAGAFGPGEPVHEHGAGVVPERHDLQRSMSVAATAMTTLCPRASSSCSSANVSAARSTARGTRHAGTCSTTSKCSTTPPGGTHRTGCCRPSISNSGTKRKPSASRKRGAVQLDCKLRSLTSPARPRCAVLARRADRRRLSSAVHRVNADSKQSAIESSHEAKIARSQRQHKMSYH